MDDTTTVEGLHGGNITLSCRETADGGGDGATRLSKAKATILSAHRRKATILFVLFPRRLSKHVPVVRRSKHLQQEQFTIQLRTSDGSDPRISHRHHRFGYVFRTWQPTWKPWLNLRLVTWQSEPGIGPEFGGVCTFGWRRDLMERFVRSVVVFVCRVSNLLQS